MNRVAAAALVFATAQAVVEAYSIQRGPDFDPTPIDIEHGEKNVVGALDSKMLLERRNFGGASISPDGRRFAYTLVEMNTTHNNYRTALVIGDIDAPQRARVVGSAGRPLWNFIGQYMRTDPEWSPDSRTVSLVKLTDAVAQVWTWDAATGQGRPLTDLTRDALCQIWLDGSSEIGMRVRAGAADTLAPPRDSPYLWTATIMAMYLIPHLDRAEEIDPSSGVLIASALTGKTRLATELERKRIESRCSTPFRRGGAAGPPELQSRDGARSAKVEDLEADVRTVSRSRVVLFSKNGRLRTAASSPGQYIELLGWLAGDRYFAFLSSPEYGERYLYVFDSTNGKFKEVRAGLDLGWVRNCSLPRDGATLVCWTGSPNALSKLVAIALDSGATTLLADPNSGLQQAVQAGYQLQKRSWTNRSGDILDGFVMVPTTTKPAPGYPAVIATYDFGGYLAVSGGEEAPLQVMAQHGFVVVCLSAQPHRTPTSSYAEAVRDWDAPLEVMHTIVAGLAAEGIVDRERVGIIGSSYGAELVDHAISHSSLFATAASSGGGSHDPPTLAYLGEAERSLYEFAGLWWDEGVTLDQWREYSPMLRAREIRTPLLIQVADRESLMPLPIYLQLKRYGTPVEMWVFPDERHVKWWPKNKLAANERNLAWFEFWLMGRCDRAKDDDQRCNRWERLSKTAW